jgi:hypothetical protein
VNDERLGTLCSSPERLIGTLCSSPERLIGVVADDQPQVLATTPGAGDTGIEQSCGQVGRPGLVAPNGPWMVDPHSGDGLASDMGRETSPDDLDFGEFRHFPARSTPPQPP